MHASAPAHWQVPEVQGTAGLECAQAPLQHFTFTGRDADLSKSGKKRRQVIDARLLGIEMRSGGALPHLKPFHWFAGI